MPKLTRQQVYTLAQQAGFTGTGLDMAVAIAAAESGFDTSATNYNPTSASTDRGLWQINNVYHSEVSDQCAYGTACAAQAAYRISSGGSNWQPWSTFTNGAYRQYLQPGGSPAITPTPGPSGVEALRKALLPNGQLISVWGDPRPAPINYHQGEDLQAPAGSPIYAPENSTVQRVYVDNIGGNAVIIAMDSGIWIYCAHLQAQSPVRQGSKIAAGTVIGLVGNTGDAATTVSHLHYQAGPQGNWADPRAVFATWTPGAWAGGGGGIGTGGIPATQLTLFDQPNYQGRSATINADLHYVAVGTLFGGGQADIRSIKATPANGVYTLYRDINYGGPFVVASGDTRDTKSAIAWTDPGKVVSSIRLGDYSGGAAGGGGTGGGIGQFVFLSKATNSWLAIGDRVHATLAEVPGFGGIALALDEAEQFPGVISYECTPSVTNPTCASEITRGAIATVIGNTLAFATRGIVSFFGMVLLVGLAWNAIKGPAGDVAQIAAIAG